jgi:murein DD-endopeptidase MepM/ murein hydrolase activator NlpD
MKKRRTGRSRLVAVAAGGFLVGAITALIVVWDLPNLTHPAKPPDVSDAAQAKQPAPIARTDVPSATEGGAVGVVATSTTPVIGPPPVSRPSNPASTLTPIVEAEPVPELRDRQLQIPVLNTARSELRDSFMEKRGSSHSHEAIDIMTPRNTPIVAVEDGTIAKLFESKAGGTTVYQFDPTTRYVYYYAHLERYADGLKEGTHVQRGQVLGYAGTSGNAAKDAPHLHFAIFRLTDKKQWWQGSPIDPYDVLK